MRSDAAVALESATEANEGVAETNHRVARLEQCVSYLAKEAAVTMEELDSVQEAVHDQDTAQRTAALERAELNLENRVLSQRADSLERRQDEHQEQLDQTRRRQDELGGQIDEQQEENRQTRRLTLGALEGVHEVCRRVDDEEGEEAFE
jgi:chromosome segregation ATPase